MPSPLVEMLLMTPVLPEKSPEEQTLLCLPEKGILIVSAAGNEFRDIDLPNGEGFYLQVIL